MYETIIIVPTATLRPALKVTVVPTVSVPKLILSVEVLVTTGEVPEVPFVPDIPEEPEVPFVPLVPLVPELPERFTLQLDCEVVPVTTSTSTFIVVPPA